MRPKANRQSEELVEALLVATERMLSTEGYERTTTNRIAEAAGVGIASLYRYFRGKDDLLRALIERHFLRIDALLTELSSVTGASVADDVARLVRHYFSLFSEYPGTHAILHQHAARLGCMEKSVELRRAMIVEVARALEAHAPIREPESAAVEIVYIVEALLLSRLYEAPSSLRVDACANDAITQIIGCLARWT